MTQTNNNIALQDRENYKRKKKILWIIIITFMTVIIIIWGYDLKIKVDNINQKSNYKAGLFQNTKEIWNDTFKTNTGTKSIISTSTWNKIVSSTQNINTTTPTTTTLNSTTMDILKKEIKIKLQPANN